MPPSLRERTAAADGGAPPTPPPGAPSDGGEVVEAPTAAAAIAEVQRVHGAGARILRAEKVLRGGVAGFFARELVQLTVDVGPHAAAATDAGAAVSSSDGTSRVLAALTDGVEDGPQGETFGELLDRRAAAARGVPTPAPTPGPDAAPSTGPTPAATGVSRVVDELARATGSREESFGAALRAAIAADETTGPTGPPAPSGGPSDEGAGAGALARRGAASLLDRPPGAARLVTDADRLARPPVGAPAPADAGVAAGPGSRDGSVTDGPRRLELADLLATTRHGGCDDEDVAAGTSTVDVVSPSSPGAAVVADGPATGRSEADGGTPPPCGAVDPLPVRHEAIRQLRASVQRLDRSGGAPPAGRATRPAASSRPAARRASAGEATAAAAVTTPGGSVWSGERLALAGLPASLVATVLAQGPADDIAWFAAVARSLEPFCPPLAAAAEVVVGPAAGALAGPLGAPVVALDEHAAPRGSCTLATARTTDARRWLAEERAGRPLHLVVGGSDWRSWLFEAPAVVSWTSEHDLADALDVASRFGAALGWSLCDGVARRATALDAAVALRTRLVAR